MTDKRCENCKWWERYCESFRERSGKDGHYCNALESMIKDDAGDVPTNEHGESLDLCFEPPADFSCSLHEPKKEETEV